MMSVLCGWETRPTMDGEIWESTYLTQWTGCAQGFCLRALHIFLEVAVQPRSIVSLTVSFSAGGGHDSISTQPPFT